MIKGYKRIKILFFFYTCFVPKIDFWNIQFRFLLSSKLRKLCVSTHHSNVHCLCGEFCSLRFPVHELVIWSFNITTKCSAHWRLIIRSNETAFLSHSRMQNMSYIQSKKLTVYCFVDHWFFFLVLDLLKSWTTIIGLNRIA